MEFYEGGIMTVVASVITGVITWLTTRKKQRNDFIAELQKSIDLLAEANGRQMREIVALRTQVSELTAGQAAALRENEQLASEIQALREQLQGVKTITRTK